MGKKKPAAPANKIVAHFPVLRGRQSVARRGEPVLVDLDGDGRPEILVPVEDGRLYCLKGK
jgi:hypothetical protein